MPFEGVKFRISSSTFSKRAIVEYFPGSEMVLPYMVVYVTMQPCYIARYYSPTEKTGNRLQKQKETGSINIFVILTENTDQPVVLLFKLLQNLLHFRRFKLPDTYFVYECTSQLFVLTGACSVSNMA